MGRSRTVQRIPRGTMSIFTPFPHIELGYKISFADAYVGKRIQNGPAAGIILQLAAIHRSNSQQEDSDGVYGSVEEKRGTARHRAGAGDIRRR